MNCRQAQAHLADCAAGFVEGSDLLQAHLAACDQCRLHLEQVRAVDRLMGADRLAAGEELVSRVMARVRHEQVGASWRWVFMLEGIGPFVAAAALVPVAILVLHGMAVQWVYAVMSADADLAMLLEPRLLVPLVAGMAVVAALMLWATKRVAEALT